MAMRAAASRLRFRKRTPSYNASLQSRTSSGGSGGRVLSDEERAAENLYIKRMEKEKLEKLAAQGGKAQESISASIDSASPALPRPAFANTSADPNKNVAVAAAVVTLVASGWWYYRANKKVPIEEEKE